MASRALRTVGHEYVGELTGSITGDVHCYGFAIHEGICIYVSMGGPRMAVEAIRAKLSKGDIVSCAPWDAPSVELTAGEGNSGMYHAYMTNIPEAKFTSLIRVQEWAVVPNYNGAATTFLFRTDDAQVTTNLKHHVTELVKVPVFDSWASYLYSAGLVCQTHSAGAIDLLTVDLDATAWTWLVTGGVEQQAVSL